MANATAPAPQRSPTLTQEQKQQWVINRQGKDYVLYAALLEIAHNQFGLAGISTKLEQIPSPDNGHVAICSASVIVEHGVFSGIGDADPGNVSRMMANALIRMAETRAKARALRDAINASAWAVDGDDDTSDDATSPKSSHQEESSTPSGAPPLRTYAQSSATPPRNTTQAPTSPGTPTWPSSPQNGNSTPSLRPPSEPAKDNRTSYGLALSSDGSAVKLIDGKPVPSLRPEPAPRGRSLTERAAAPVNDDANGLDLRSARAKWAATIKIANAHGIPIPVMTDAQMADVSELMVEGRKLGRAIRMKEQEQLGLVETPTGDNAAGA